GLARGGDGLDGAERHEVAAREDAVDVGMRLQHVLKDVEALIALPVRRLGGDDHDAWRAPHRLAKSAEPRVAGFMTRNAFENADAGLAAAGLDQILAGEPAAIEVIGAD